MEISDAQNMVASEPEAVSNIRARLADHHADHPQRAALADLHLRAIESALQGLAALGHRFMITEVEREALIDFPAMMYRDSNNSRSLDERIVHDQREMDEARKEGWREHPRAVREQSLGVQPGEQSDDPHASSVVDGAAGAGATTGEKDLVSHTTSEQAEVLDQAQHDVLPPGEEPQDAALPVDAPPPPYDPPSQQ